jgi:carbohydrate-selective porin OprB
LGSDPGLTAAIAKRKKPKLHDRMRYPVADQGSRSVFITPDIQYIINPDGTSRIRNALCVALQINATF